MSLLEEISEELVFEFFKIYLDKPALKNTIYAYDPELKTITVDFTNAVSEHYRNNTHIRLRMLQSFF